MTLQAQYSNAVITMLHEGIDPEAVLRGLQRMLAEKHHDKLYPVIIRNVYRQLAATVKSAGATVSVARPADAEAYAQSITIALQRLGVPADTPVTEQVDSSLTGGFVATYDYQELDQSYKAVLANLYASITS